MYSKKAQNARGVIGRFRLNMLASAAKVATQKQPENETATMMVMRIKDQAISVSKTTKRLMFASSLDRAVTEAESTNQAVMAVLELARFNSDDTLTVLTHNVIDILTQES